MPSQAPQAQRTNKAGTDALNMQTGNLRGIALFHFFNDHCHIDNYLTMEAKTLSNRDAAIANDSSRS
jgi:hypothetical protein